MCISRPHMSVGRTYALSIWSSYPPLVYFQETTFYILAMPFMFLIYIVYLYSQTRKDYFKAFYRTQMHCDI